MTVFFSQFNIINYIISGTPIMKLIGGSHWLSSVQCIHTYPFFYHAQFAS